MEIPLHSAGHSLAAPVGLEALDVDAETLRPLPQVRIINPAAIRIERVDHLEEAALATGGLGRGVKSRRARMLGGDREVAEDEASRPLPQSLPGGGAAWAAEVPIDDQARLSIADDMIVGADGGYRSAG